MSDRPNGADPSHVAPERERIAKIADAVAGAARAALWDAVPHGTAGGRLIEVRVYHRLGWPGELVSAARWARHHGASWQQIGAAAGIDADTARDRFPIPTAWRGYRHLPQDPDWRGGGTSPASASAAR